MAASLYLSFTEYNVVNPPQWIGLENYERLFGSVALFRKSLWVTLEYSLARVPLIIVVGLALAMLINARIPGMAFFRVSLYLPSVIPLVAASVLWLWFLNPQLGFLNPLIRETTGWSPPNWLRDPDLALYAIVALGIWQVGHTMMIFLAGLQEIPRDLYEAAEIDGCGPIQRLRHVTLPMMTPTIYFNLIIGVIQSFQAFAAVFILTRGGPANETLIYVVYLYRRGVEFIEMGYASAMAALLVAAILALTALIMATSDKWVTYDRG
jgi:multiple sugar transport system permease protein